MKGAILFDLVVAMAFAAVLYLTIFRRPTDRLGRVRRARPNRYTLPGRRS